MLLIRQEVLELKTAACACSYFLLTLPNSLHLIGHLTVFLVTYGMPLVTATALLITPISTCAEGSLPDLTA